MPIPQFSPGEVLSAMRLNAMVDVVNRASTLISSASQPFEQVQMGSDLGQDITWNWMFRYAPSNRYWKLRYVWSSRSAAAAASGYINGVQVFNDPAGGATGEHNHTIDMASLGLFPGSIYTFDIECLRHDSAYFRVIWLFNTNDSTYAPTIIQ